MGYRGESSASDASEDDDDDDDLQDWRAQRRTARPPSGDCLTPRRPLL
jgi:hypothetical protein